jgi:growth hormone-inducible transmembrane protein
MAFVLRRPFVITSTLRQVSQVSKPQALIRQFHQAPPKQSSLFNSKPQTGFILSRQNIFREGFKRSYSQNVSSQVQTGRGEFTRRALYGAGIFGGTLVAINLIFNRETREDGGMPPFEREYLNDTFMHTGLGLGTIAIAASALHRSGWSYRLMAANPWLVVGVGLASSIGSMIATQMTPPEK